MQEIITRYMAANNLTRTQFAKGISDQLPREYGYTPVAIGYWLSGQRMPDIFRLYYLATHATGWVRDFAVDALAAIDEDVERRR